MNDMDSLLFDALSPKMKPDAEINQRIIGIGKESKVMAYKNAKRRKASVVAACAATLVLVSAGTSYAAIHYFSAKDVAGKLEDSRLEKAFSGRDAVQLDEVKEAGGYRFKLLGMVSGKNLSDSKLKLSDGTVREDRTYVVMATEKTDGGKLGDESFVVSPEISGFRVQDVNIGTLSGGSTRFYSDDRTVLYELVDMENIEPFANHEIYLAVKNADVNVKFKLPVDASKADEAKVAKLLKGIHDGAGEKPVVTEADKFMKKLTPENLDKYAEPVESTKVTLTPNSEGMVSWKYKIQGEEAQGTSNVRDLFPDGKTGLSKQFSYVGGEKGVKDLHILTFALNKDGSVTFEVYTPVK